MSEAPTSLAELDAALWNQNNGPGGCPALEDVARWLRVGSRGLIDLAPAHSSVKVIALTLRFCPRITDADAATINAEIAEFRKAGQTILRVLGAMHDRGTKARRRLNMPAEPLPAALQTLADDLPAALAFAQTPAGRPQPLWHDTARTVAPHVRGLCMEHDVSVGLSANGLYVGMVCAIVQGWTGQKVTAERVRQSLDK